MNPSELPETPGGYYGFAYWLNCLLFIMLNKPRYSIGKHRSLIILFFFLIFGLLHFNANVPMAFFIPSMILCWSLMYLFLWLCTGLSIKNAGYYTVQAFIFAEFSASLEWQIYFYALHTGAVPDSLPVNIGFLLAAHGILFSLFYLLQNRYGKEAQGLQISGKELMYALFFGLLVFSLSNLSYLNRNTPFSSSGATDIFNIRTMVDFGGVALLFAYHIQLAEHHMKFEFEKLENLLSTQYANFRMYENSVNLVNRTYHDLKHQIAAIRMSLKRGNGADYLDKLEKEIKIFETQNKTGNKILDIVLTAYGIKGQNGGITLTCVADGGLLDFMDDIDISTLFGNILDNAFEAVRALAGEERLVHIAISREKGFLRIREENRFEGNLAIKDALPLTTKRDARLHGFGLKSVKAITEKYQGSLNIGISTGWFELGILIPLPRTGCEEGQNIDSNRDC